MSKTIVGRTTIGVGPFSRPLRGWLRHGLCLLTMSALLDVTPAASAESRTALVIGMRISYGALANR